MVHHRTPHLVPGQARVQYPRKLEASRSAFPGWSSVVHVTVSTASLKRRAAGQFTATLHRPAFVPLQTAEDPSKGAPDMRLKLELTELGDFNANGDGAALDRPASAADGPDLPPLARHRARSDPGRPPIFSCPTARRNKRGARARERMGGIRGGGCRVSGGRCRRLPRAPARRWGRARRSVPPRASIGAGIARAAAVEFRRRIASDARLIAAAAALMPGALG